MRVGCKVLMSLDKYQPEGQITRKKSDKDLKIFLKIFEILRFFFRFFLFIFIEILRFFRDFKIFLEISIFFLDF